ncbi:hypothetical protein BROUX41_006451 [Berkeleyomyces rouxiae]
MRFSAVFTFAAAVMASPITVRQVGASPNVYQLYTKSNFAEVNDKPLSVVSGRVGIWSGSADALSVSNSGPTATTLSTGTDASTALGVNATTRNDGSKTYLQPLIATAQDSAPASFSADGFKLTPLSETGDAQTYSVSWADARSWLAGPVRENAESGSPGGWEIMMRPNTDGVVAQIYMPVEIIAKLVTQS